MENLKNITKSAEETKTLAEGLAKELLLRSENANRSQLICLWGGLGAGKTTFVQGLAKEIGIKGIINSPTFLIMKKYILSGEWEGYNLFHFDCYRIEDAEEILSLGWREILENPKNIVLVEWPEKIIDILPSKKIDVEFNFIEDDLREINFRHL
jgi:tRNA threonylcarbamoyladenosine biosynthesis protein TsaE